MTTIYTGIIVIMNRAISVFVSIICLFVFVISIPCGLAEILKTNLSLFLCHKILTVT